MEKDRLNFTFRGQKIWFFKVLVKGVLNMEFKGIDVSKWNRNIDWQKIKSEGVDFVIIREGHDKKLPTQSDRKFKENIMQAQNCGINCGVYHYSYSLECIKT